ncbi:hypothetical protein GmHk_17G049824 [Glycine max]|nr:hypothetical protein GmHk_17G049824 [Glycine max]
MKAYNTDQSMDGIAEHSPSSFVVEKEKLELTLVPPFSFGLGLPYAHEGYFSVLSSLQTSCAHSRLLQSKADIERWKVSSNELGSIKGYPKIVSFHYGIIYDSKLQWCKMKLSSYLALDFCTLVSSEYDVFPLAWVASVVVKDPKLTIDQLDLKLEKKLKVSCLKNEYIEWKDKVRKTNVVIEEMISSIQEINEKLVPLQEKLLVKSSILEDAQKSKVELNCRLVSTANSITSLVEEIEL